MYRIHLYCVLQVEGLSASAVAELSIPYSIPLAIQFDDQLRPIATPWAEPPLQVSPYKIFFHFKALLCESIILLFPPPTCKAYPITILLYAHFAIYAPPPTPRLYAMHHTLLAMPISCKGQAAGTLPQWTRFWPLHDIAITNIVWCIA